MKRMEAFSTAFWVLSGLTAVLAAVAWMRQGPAGVGAGFREGGALLVSIFPSLLVGFALAGFVQVLVPQDFVARHIGEGSGFRGLLWGSVAGALTPGGPFIHIPIIASFLQKGAAVGPISAYLTAWALLSVLRIAMWEVPLLGTRFVVARIVASILVPPAVGMLTTLVYRRVGGS